MPIQPARRTALVLSGGGARGAYEAGVIHYVRSQLTPKNGARRVFNVHIGSSVGAINTCFMASMADNLAEQGKMLYSFWKNLDQNKIYKRNITAITQLLGQTVKGVTMNLLRLNPFDLKNRPSTSAHFHGFLDTSPLPKYLNQVINFKQIAANLKKGVIDAVSLTATNASTGFMELFIQKRPNVEYTGEYVHRFLELKSEHAMASAAIPLIFPPVKVGDIFYTDGGLKLNTPLSPAIQLGADKIMVIGLHRNYSMGEKPVRSLTPPGEHPSLGQLVGQIMNALFLDRIQYDVEQLTRINRMIAWSEKLFGKDYLSKINDMLIKEGIRGDIANRGLMKIRVLQINPSVDLADIFAESYHGKEAQHSFTAFEKMLLRIMDVDPAAGVDILSYLAFMPLYISRLLELGFEDAHAHRDEIIDFLTDV